MAPAAEAAPSEEELPEVEVIETSDGVAVAVKWGEGGARQTRAGLSDSYADTFLVTDENGEEPLRKTFGTLLYCTGGITTIGGERYAIQVKQQQQQQQANDESLTSVTKSFGKTKINATGNPLDRSTKTMPDLFVPTEKTNLQLTLPKRC